MHKTYKFELDGKNFVYDGIGGDVLGCRDYLMGKVIVQIQEVADHLQELTVQVSNRGQELALLLDRVKTLGLRAKAFEQLQKDLQDQLQEKLEKMQNNMREQMIEAQKNMMAQMAQLLARAMDKGKGPMAITRQDGEDHPSGFTPPPVPAQAEVPPRRPSVTIRPQHESVDAEIPMNFPASSRLNLGDNSANPITPDLDVVEKERIAMESLKQLEDRCKWLEEKFRGLFARSYQGHV
ncbi:hypothetical protein J1N35_046000 [Gossypium stocksii]|uniref:Uncharacterized protein n=1 Tax=Gossypium stocksii TaxID=47602 RepID=A0A9D3UCK2_9ROSI|nr:hypothetical protein J1N35_046000 [Gossypium stocksii]